MCLRAYMLKFIIGFLMIAFLVTDSFAAEENTSPQILILASYNPGLKWTDSQGSEIENQLYMYYLKANFSFEPIFVRFKPKTLAIKPTLF